MTSFCQALITHMNDRLPTDGEIMSFAAKTPEIDEIDGDHARGSDFDDDKDDMCDK